MSDPKLLDLFCCAGAATDGYTMTISVNYAKDVEAGSHILTWDWSDLLFANLAMGALLCHAHEFGVQYGVELALDPYREHGDWGWEPGCGKSAEDP